MKLLSGTTFSHISEEATARALAAFGHFSAVAAQFGVPLQAMATSGLRDADSAGELVHKVQHKVRATTERGTSFNSKLHRARVHRGSFISTATQLRACSTASPSK